MGISGFHLYMILKDSMYLGKHQLSFENDRRVVVPELFREMFTGGAYVTRGFEQNLMIMSETVFQKLYQQAMTFNITNPLARLLQRLIFGNASRLEMDASGHILIPEDLKSFAGLEEVVILVGQGNYLEVWAPAAWGEQNTRLLDVKANSERFAQLDLSLH